MSSLTPWQCAEMYSRGEMSRDQIIEAVTQWTYLTDDGERRTEGERLDYLPGSWDDMEAALDAELVDQEIFDLALTALRFQQNSRQTRPF